MENVIVSSYVKQNDPSSNGKYTITVEASTNESAKTIPNCYRFKTGIMPLIGSYVSKDGYHFIESDRLENEVNHTDDQAKRVIYYFDKRVPIKDGKPSPDMKELSYIKNSAFVIPHDYCVNIDPPHIFLEPICVTAKLPTPITTSETTAATSKAPITKDEFLGETREIVVIVAIISSLLLVISFILASFVF